MNFWKEMIQDIMVMFVFVVAMLTAYDVYHSSKQIQPECAEEACPVPGFEELLEEAEKRYDRLYHQD